jgi:hypothetical protein
MPVAAATAFTLFLLPVRWFFTACNTKKYLHWLSVFEQYFFVLPVGVGYLI